MKNKIIITLSLICLSAFSAFAQGDWSVGDQSYSPAMGQSQGIPSSAKLTVKGTYTWMFFQDVTPNASGMQLVYELPACVIPSTGTPAVLFMDRTPVPGVSFTPTATGYIANFASTTVLPMAAKIIFQISDLEIKDDVNYTNQDAKHSATFQTPPVEELTSNNSATITFNTVAVNGPLPIQLLDFTATLLEENATRKVKLDWTTVTEMNSAHFIVQKSKDLVKWEDVVQVKAAGNSATNIDYSSNDLEPYMGLSYYRLKQFDLDGEYDYSKIRSVNWKTDGASNVRLHPNPTSDVLNVTVNLEGRSLIEVKLRGIDGRVVQSAVAYVERGNNDLEMDLSKLANGVYNLTVYKDNQEFYTSKVQKQ